MSLPIAEEPGSTVGITSSGVEKRFLVRDILTANRTYYVRTDGNDANNGRENTASGAFLTPQRAIDVLAGMDSNGFQVTIQIAPGIYRGSINFANPWIGGGSVVIQGDLVSPSKVTILPPSDDAIKIESSISGFIAVQGLRLMARNGNGLRHAGTGQVFVGTMEFDECGMYHISTSGPGAYLYLTQSYNITGGAQSHIVSDSASLIDIGDITITAAGEIAFINFIASTRRAGINCAATFDAPEVTGTRFFIDSNGMIFTSGSGQTYFPGDKGGVLNTGGRYV